MLIYFLLIPLILMIPLGIYLNIYIKRMAEFFTIDIKIKSVKIIITIITVIIAICCINIWGIPALVIFHILALSFCMELVNGIKKIIDKKRKVIRNNLIWSKIYKSGLAPILITLLIFCYGYMNMTNIIETDYTIHTEKNIRQEGYRVAMIADLHYGTILHKEQLEKVSKEIEGTNPDVVILCGDIVDESTTLEEMEEAMELLGNIHSEYGTFIIYGNHDLSTYSSKPYYDEIQLKESINNNGIHLLVDESYEINDDFVIVGRDDASFTKDAKRISGQDLIENINKDKLILLLDHQPIELKKNSQLGFDLQLSGHTHAGQIWPTGVLSQMFGLVEFNYGYVKIGDLQIIVSSGISGWGYPIRTGFHSEYDVIDITKSNNKQN